MVWFFERNAEVPDLETRYDNDTSEYIVELRRPDGEIKIERFATADAFRTRLLVIERGLGGQRWRLDGPPLMVPDGWPDRKPSR